MFSKISWQTRNSRFSSACVTWAVGVEVLGDVLAEDVHRLELALDRRVEHLRDRALLARHRDALCGLERLRDLLVLDRAVGRGAVGQRAHVGRALHVVLTAQRQERRAGAADVARHQHEVADQLHDLGAGSRCSVTPRPQLNEAVRLTRRRCAAARSMSAAGMPVISSTSAGVRTSSELDVGVVALGAPRDEVGVDQAVAQDDVVEAEHHSRVGARARREVQDAVVGELDAARVDRDDLGAVEQLPASCAHADDRGGPASGWRP